MWRLAVLGIALAATLATSCIPYTEIDRVVIEDGLIYLDGYSYGEGGLYILVSRDDGKSWDSIAVDDLPVSIATYLDQTPQLPKTVCNPSDPQYCFRITGASRVEYSNDSGQTWDTAWRFPVWRLGYLNRKNTGPCGVGEIQTSPLDLALHTDEFGGMTLFVAMGNQGLVVHSADDSWSSADVPETRPFPTSADNLATAWQDVFYERAFYGLGSITMWFVLHAMGWKLTLDGRGIPVTSRQIAWWVILPVLLSLLPVYVYINTPNPIGPNLWLLYISLAVLMAGPILTWFLKITPPLPRLTLITSLLSFLTATLLFTVPVFLSILWALGLIPLHIITVAINLLLYWFILRFSIRTLRSNIPHSLP
jgi:hypothetical protein